MKVYLSGSVREEKYRDYVIEKYSDVLRIFDPMRSIDEKLIDKAVNKERLNDHEISRIVLFDKAAIKKCDILVAYMEIYSAGTIMEILYTYEHDIPVIIIDPLKNMREDIWIRYHSLKFLDSIDECFDYILTIKDMSI